MIYELATLRLSFAGAGSAPQMAMAYAQSEESGGELLACFQPEFGALNSVLMIRSFRDESELFNERRRLRASKSPFGIGDELLELELDSYLPFPGFDDLQPGTHGRLYEIRTYRVKPGGLARLMPEWAAAAPARSRYSPLLSAMYAVDGSNRMTHIWPYPSFDERATARARAVAECPGWPTPSGLETLDPRKMESAVYRPVAGSPMC